jgi:hypothetical protein
LRHLFHLHFSLRHVLDGRKKPDDQDDHCALVYPILSELGDWVYQNLNEQDDLVSTKHLRVLDDRVLKKQGALDELLFPDVPILKNPNELDARCENDLVLD